MSMQRTLSTFRDDSGAQHLRKFGNLSIRGILTITWPYVRPPVRPSVHTTGKPMWNVKLSSLCGSLLPVFNLMVYIHIMFNWQLSKQGIRWPESHDQIAGSGTNSSRSCVFKLFADQLLAFNWSQVQVYVFQSYGSPIYKVYSSSLQ